MAAGPHYAQGLQGVVLAGGLAAANAGKAAGRLCGGIVLLDWYPRRALARHGNGLGAAQILAGGRVRVGLDLLERALGHDLAAMHASARPHIDDVVGRTHHVFVVLDHDDAVANVPQVLQRGNQAVVVALVQANAGFVQYIHHARQAAANLAGQANALGLAA